uniref:Putative thioredoxin-like protein n=1 Tax=Tabanus bromius TaxID=304241 RepID=A0A0K8TNW9_TABBR
MPHGHSHGAGNNCEHQSSDVDRALEKGIQYSLYQKIDLQNVECLNEETEGSAKFVFKPYERRFDYEQFVQSDDQRELLLNIPFTGNIKLKGIIIVGPDEGMCPDKVKLYKNRPGMTFGEASGVYDQEIELAYDPVGEVEYTPKAAVFSTVHHLSMYFPSNFGAENTKISYIGLRGEFTEVHDHGVTICNYELRPNLTDHKNNLFDSMKHEIQ